MSASKTYDSSGRVQAHYDGLLAQHYVWMATGGDYEAGVRESVDLFTSWGLAMENGSALDLGSGPGMQAAALTRLGYARVTAIDGCEALVEETRRANSALVDAGKLRPILGDLLDAALVADGAPFDLIMCVGDTLTHLADIAAVDKLIANTRLLTKPGGKLLLRFRDLTRPLEGIDRFISVRADADRIMTCFLEDAGPEQVGVTDLIYLRQERGEWQLHKSGYRKLRLSEYDISARLRERGFRIEAARTERGLVSILATN